MGKYLDQAITEIGVLITESMRDSLFQKGISSSGDLAASIQPQVTTQRNKATTLQIELASYAQFVENGRRKGAKQPPSSAIKEWIMQKGITKPAKYSLDSFAFVIARGISRNGIKPRPFIQTSIDNTMKNRGYDLILDGILKDIIAT
jgi:hypothetical protein